MSNIHLKDKDLSLKAKGLMSVILSLPDEWEFSLNGLYSMMGKDGERSVKSAFDELVDNGYITVTKLFADQSESGHIEYRYDIYEGKKIPQNVALQNVGVENVGLHNVSLQNDPQLNTNKSSTKRSTTKKEELILGEFRTIHITQENYDDFVRRYGKEDAERYIAELDRYLDSNPSIKVQRYFSKLITWAENDKKWHPNGKTAAAPSPANKREDVTQNISQEARAYFKQFEIK